MKKLRHVMALAMILAIYLSCKAQQIQEPNLSTKIIGTWIHNDDNKVKLVFDNSGKRFDYYDNELIDTFDYYITTECNGRITTENYHIFLKLVDNEDLITTECNLLNAIHTDPNGVTTLSITSSGGKLNLYTQQ